MFSSRLTWYFHSIVLPEPRFMLPVLFLLALGTGGGSGRDEPPTSPPRMPRVAWYLAGIFIVVALGVAATRLGMRSALQPVPADPLATARTLEEQGAFAAAAGAYDQVFAADPTNADAAMAAGLVYRYHLGDPARAVERYQAVLRLMPTHYGAHYQLAVALLAAGREDEARTAWREFVPLAERIGDRASLAGAPEALRR